MRFLPPSIPSVSHRTDQVVLALMFFLCPAHAASLPPTPAPEPNAAVDEKKAVGGGKVSQVPLEVKVLWSGDAKQPAINAEGAEVQILGTQVVGKADKNGIAKLGKIATGKTRLQILYGPADICQVSIDVGAQMKVPVVLLSAAEKKCLVIP